MFGNHIGEIVTRTEGFVGYHATIEEIGPERAEYLLAHNYDGNRRVRNAYVEQLAEVMRQDRFISENGQTVVVGDDDGILYDAQHRLRAIVESGKTYKFIVAYIIDGKEKFTTIDANTPRSASDFIDLPNKNDCAAFAKVAAAIEWGTAPLLSCMSGFWSVNTRVDRGLVVLYCEQNAEKVVRRVRQGRRMREAVNCGPVKAYSTFMEIVDIAGELELLDDFVDDFCGLSPSNLTVIALKKKIVNAHLRATAKPSYKWMVGTLLDAYHHYQNNDDGTMFNKQEQRLREYSDKLDKKSKASLTSTDIRNIEVDSRC